MAISSSIGRKVTGRNAWAGILDGLLAGHRFNIFDIYFIAAGNVQVECSGLAVRSAIADYALRDTYSATGTARTSMNEWGLADYNLLSNRTNHQGRCESMIRNRTSST